MDDVTTIGIIGQESFKHPSVLTAGNQLQKLYNDNEARITKAIIEWQATAPKAPGPIERIGVLFEIMQKDPRLSALLIQALGILYPHIPETQQALAELQTAVSAAPA
jgi:hypothetical protein